MHVDDDFCPSIFPMGVSGFIFHGAIQNEIPEHMVSRIGLRGVFDGTVVGLCRAS